jgi:cytochrome oxidase complex assembly protein 1
MTALPPFWSWGGARLVPKLGPNWPRCLLAGCLGMLFLAASVFFVIVSIAFGAMKSSDAYKTALSKAKGDPRVVNALGFPITDGFFVWGTTNVSGSSGYADLTIPIAGSKGKGTIYFVASKFAGEWTFSKLIIEVGKTGERIDLTEKRPRTVP